MEARTSMLARGPGRPARAANSPIPRFRASTGGPPPFCYSNTTAAGNPEGKSGSRGEKVEARTSMGPGRICAVSGPAGAAARRRRPRRRRRSTRAGRPPWAETPPGFRRWNRNGSRNRNRISVTHCRFQSRSRSKLQSRAANSSRGHAPNFSRALPTPVAVTLQTSVARCQLQPRSRSKLQSRAANSVLPKRAGCPFGFHFYRARVHPGTAH